MKYQNTPKVTAKKIRRKNIDTHSHSVSYERYAAKVRKNEGSL